MSKLQDIGSIAPMSDSCSGGGGGAKNSEYEKGKRLLENGNYGEAAGALHNALLAYEEKNDRNGIANACNQLGHVCLAKEDYEGALQHYTRTRKICEELQDYLSVFALSKTFVDVYVGLGQYDEAITTSFDLLDGYHANNDPRGAVAVLEKMAEIYKQAGRPEKAVDAYKTVASIHRNFKHESIADSFEKKAEELATAS